MLVVLMWLTALNVSQAMVLCLGTDGHIAVEPAGHDHCADGSHEHDRDLTAWEAADHSHVGPGQCRPCIDIPFPDGTSDARHRPTSSPARAVGTAPAIQIPGTLDALSTAPSLWSSRFLCCSSSLRSTILQV